MLVLAMVATVLMLVCMGFFMWGSLPLLILKHDTPLDARFIRGLFYWYYRVLMVTAGVAATAHTLAGRPWIGLGLGLVAAAGFAGYKWFVGNMDALRETMTADDAAGIRKFRRLHINGMLCNVALLACICLGMVKASL